MSSDDEQNTSGGSSSEQDSGSEHTEGSSDGDNTSKDEARSSSESDSSAEKKPKQRAPPSSKKALKFDDQTRELLQSDNFLRRSNRRAAPVDSVSDESPPPPSKSKKRKLSSDEQYSSDDSYSETRQKRKAKGPAKLVRKTTARNTRHKDKVVYNESGSSAEESVSDDEEDDDAGNTLTTYSAAAEDANGETIERVLRHREGIPGATGPVTTAYNMEDKGDPNADVESRNPDELERQYFIKWFGWSHLHNTWESENTLKAAGVKGAKKVENYLKKLSDLNRWRKKADKEDIEYFNCEQELHDEQFEEYKKVERIIAHQVSRDRNTNGTQAMEFFIKWQWLPYSECTWEDEGLIRKNYGDRIDDYFRRISSKTLPNKNNPTLFTRRRPKFTKIEKMPDFLRRRDNPDMELRDYQLEGLNWLLHAWSRENSCILADEMGLGKTIQTISFLSALFHVHDVHGPFLVVVPLSTMTAWQREFEIWAPNLNAVVYMGDVVSREQIRQFELMFANGKQLKINALLTTYEILLKDKSYLSSFDWACLVVDEAHRLKNNEALLYQCLSGFNTVHRLLITGTPLQNSLRELWALLHFIMPEKFGSWAEFEREHEDPDHRGISALHKKLEPYLLRRVKKDVEKSLPAKVEQILRVDMTAQQKQYYKWILTKNYQELSKGIKGSINGFVNLIMELKKCCNHCSLVRQYDHFAKDTQTRLQQLLKSSGKLILLDKLLCRLKETGHRVLIFSQMVMMLDLLQEYMKLRRFTTQRLDGSMRSDLRKQALDHFNAPGSTDFCFLLSTRAGGLGINLATADTVIIFDSDWNPQNDLQAMSRAHRIGQKKQVNIYRFVTKASVEEEIVERAKKKLVLDHLVIQRMDTTGKTVLSKNAVASTKVPFDKADLNAILKFGAEELFREKEGEEQEPEVDIDDILTRAETRECENTANDNELLSAFKYANFALDEEKDLAALRQNVVKDGGAGGSTNADKEWDEIIPEDQLEKLREEERQKVLQETNLGPRQRTKVVNGSGATNGAIAEGSDDDDDSTDDEDAGRAGKRGPYKRKIIFNFTDAEIKRFAKALKKFSHPLDRLDAIAADAELEDHSTAEMNELTVEVMRLLTEAAAAEQMPSTNGTPVATKGKKKPDRGPIVKIGGTDIYVRPILKQHNELEVMHQFMATIVAPYELPVSPKGQFDWDVEWSEVDDSSILRGIYKYGLGNWEAIKMDPDFGLADKIWLKDKIKKPQPKHLQTRLEYLLRLLRKHYGTSDAAGPPRKRARVEKVPKVKASKEDVHESGRKSKKMKKENKKEDRKASKDYDREHRPQHGSPTNDRDIKREPKDNRSRIANIVIQDGFAKDLDNQKGEAFKKCVDNFRPVQKYIRKLNDSKGKDDGGYDRYLVKLGDHITKYIEEMNPSGGISSEQTRWHNYMWIFLSRFTGHSHNELVKKYAEKVSAKSKDHHHHHHHKDREQGEKTGKPVSPVLNHQRDHRDRDYDRRSHHGVSDAKRDRDRHHQYNNVHSSSTSSHRYQMPSTSNANASGDRSHHHHSHRDRDRSDRDRDRDHHHTRHHRQSSKESPPPRSSTNALFPYNSPLLGGASTATSTPRSLKASSRWGPTAPPPTESSLSSMIPPPPVPPASFDAPAAKVSRFSHR